MYLASWLDSVRLRLGKVSHRRARMLERPVEILEDRTLLSVSALFVGNELNVQSDAGDSITIQEDPGNPGFVEVLDDGVPVSSLPPLDASDVEAIVVRGGDEGNVIDLSGVTSAVFDNATNPGGITIFVDGGDGNDTITGSPDINDSLLGNDGDDTINGLGGDDTIDGGDGNDLISGGDGADSIFGMDGDDTLSGNAGSDTIDAGDGDDTVDGGTENDSILGGTGLDTVSGGDGDDTIEGGMGADLLQGDAGNDLIMGKPGDDLILGGDGDDFLDGQKDNDTVLGGDGNDTLEGGKNDDSLLGEEGDDVLIGAAGNDTLAGGRDNDTIFGGAGKDSIFGDFEDPLLLGFGNNLLKGQGGADTITGGGGSDTMEGGTGDDLLVSNDELVAAPITISITDFTQNPEGDSSASMLFSGETAFPTVAGLDLSSIVSADIDGDGDLDFIFDETVIFNDGAANFAGALQLPTGSGPFFRGFIDAGDLDGDGDIDLVLPGNDVEVFFNDGSGVFTLNQTIDQGSFFGPDAVELADFNGDGFPDLATIVAFAEEEVRINFNDGTGNFGPVTVFPVTTGSHEDIDAADFDGDGDIDIIVAKNGRSEIAFLRNNGNGTFAPAIITSVNSNLDALAYGDFDGDGDLDIVAAGATITILFNGGSANFTQTQILTDSFFFSGKDVEVGDVDSDGDLDIIAGNDSGGFGVYLNDGTGLFLPPFEFTPTNTLNFFGADFILEDLNGDGNLDIGYGNGANAVRILNSGIIPVFATFTVSLSAVSTNVVTVDFQTIEGTATDGADFLGAAGTLTFDPGITSQLVAVQVLGDTVAEADETFFVNLSNPVNAIIADGQGQGGIVDDDGGTPGPTFSIADVSIVEGDSGVSNVVATVTLSAASGVTETVDFSTADGTATAGTDYTATSGTLTFTAGTTTQTISVPVNGDRINEGNETFEINLANATVLAADARAIVTITDDDAAIAPTVPDDTLRGGDGNDTLIGSIGSDQLSGMSGNDSLDGGGNSDTLFGGSGKDTLLGNEGDDQLDGQGGPDFLDGGNGNDSLIWTGASSGDDTLTATSGSNDVEVRGTDDVNTFVIDQFEGQLRITEGSSFALIDVTIRNIVVDADAGDDFITINSIDLVAISFLTINGQGGDDTITAATAQVGMVRLQINGGRGDDILTGSLGPETLDGGDGLDTLMGLAGDDTLVGGDGEDQLDGGDGDDNLSGGDADDTLIGGAGNDSLAGEDGDDSLTGGDGNDTLIGDNGMDTLEGNAGMDSLSGGNDSDTLMGGTGNDTIEGGANADSIRGNGGDDFIFGNDGSDFILAGNGNDTVDGGDNDDTIEGGNGNDLIAGGDGNDSILGKGGSDTILGGDGDDTLIGGGSKDTLLGGQGVDRLRGQGAVDLIAGGEGDDDPDSANENSDPTDVVDDDFVLAQVILDMLVL